MQELGAQAKRMPPKPPRRLRHDVIVSFSTVPAPSQKKAVDTRPLDDTQHGLACHPWGRVGYMETRRLVRSGGSSGGVGGGASQGGNYTTYLGTREHIYSPTPSGLDPRGHTPKLSWLRGEGRGGGGERRGGGGEAPIVDVDGCPRERVVARRAHSWSQQHLLTCHHSSSSPPRPGGNIDDETQRTGAGHTPRIASMFLSDEVLEPGLSRECW
jgi:hypothetical protein